MAMQEAREALEATAAELRSELERVERALAAIGGTSVATGARARKLPASNTLSLRAAIAKQLKGRTAPTRLTTLVDALTASGFTSASRNFRSNVSAMLSQMKRKREVKHWGERGYTLR